MFIYPILLGSGSHPLPGGGTHPVFTDEEFWQPVYVYIEWLRSYHFYIGEHYISFFEMFLAGMLFSVVIWFLIYIITNQN